jgi:heme oxygenase
MKNWFTLETPQEKAEFVRSYQFLGLDPDVKDRIVDEIKRAFEALDKLKEMERNRRNAIYTGY